MNARCFVWQICSLASSSEEVGIIIETTVCGRAWTVWCAGLAGTEDSGGWEGDCPLLHYAYSDFSVSGRLLNALRNLMRIFSHSAFESCVAYRDWLARDCEVNMSLLATV